MIQNLPVWPPAGEGYLNITELFADLQPSRQRSPEEKRVWLYVISNGRCAECGGFLSAAGLRPVRSEPTDEYPFVRVSATCSRC